MHLFLQGRPRIGKSSVLREALAPHAERICGVMNQRLFEGGEIAGYRVVRLAGAYPPLEAERSPEMQPGVQGVFLYRREKYPARLEEAIAAAEADCALPEKRIVLLDEIGGFELTSPAFMGPLERMLSCGKPCVGVLKSWENAERSAGRMGVDPEELRALHRRLTGLLEERGRLLTVTADNLEEVRRAVAAHVAGLLK